MRRSALAFIAFLLLPPAPPLAGATPIRDWTAPPTWTPAPAGPGRDALASGALAGSALPSAAMPFVAITPCRLADTRGNGFTGPYGPPSLPAGGARTMTITGRCGIPAGALAVSFNVTVTGTLGAGFILAYPAGGAAPSVSTLNYSANQTVANAAVIPLSDAGAATFVAGVSGTHLILDVNGYYAPGGVVSSVNGLVGALTLAQGTNVTITPTGSTLTIASTPGTHSHAATDITSGTLPTGRLSGTYSGALSFSNTLNAYTGLTLTLSGDLNLATTSRVMLGGIPFLYTAGDTNTFAGVSAGNAAATGKDSSAFGMGALAALDTGSGNTGIGSGALAATATGTENTGVGANALGLNVGDANTAVGANALGALASGSSNIALGANAGSATIAGTGNIHVGNPGAEENDTTRIGQTQTRAFIAGVRGVTVSGGVAVYVDSLGQLGTTVSSRRYKRDIADLGGASAVLLQLRPVSFRYTEDRDPSGERQYGLIAEEVAEVAPDLVVYGKDGEPETVKYHLVNALLLEEVRQLRAAVEELKRKVASLSHGD